MKSNSRKYLSIFIILMIVVVITASFSIFMYSKSGLDSKLVAGDIYMHYRKKDQGIIIIDGTPNSSYKADNYFEFTIDGKNTYEKKDIIYEIGLSYGEIPNDKNTRIKDELLSFRLVTVSEDGVETEIFKEKTYSSLDGAKIHIDTVPKNTLDEIKTTYRLYMWINQDTKICGGEITNKCDYSDGTSILDDLDLWSDTYASINVDVTGDFDTKETSDSIIRNIDMPTVSKPIIYNGIEQESGISCPIGTSPSGDIKGTSAGSYSIVCSIINKDTYKWADDTNDDKTFTWTIGKTEPIIILGEVPKNIELGNPFELNTTSNIPGKYVYELGSQTGITINKTESVSGLSDTLSVNITRGGTYIVTVKFIPDDKDNYQEIEKVYSIGPAIELINVPTNELCVSKTYNGVAQQITSVIETDEYELSGYSQINAGPHTITAKLKPGFIWNDNTMGVKTFECSINQSSITVTPPSKTNLTYNGSEQELLIAGSCSGGTMMYSTSENGTYTSSIPTATDSANDYVVWYYCDASSDANYYDSEKGSITDIFISRDVISVSTAPTKKSLSYTGNNQNLVNAGTCSAGTMKYSTSETGTFSETIPTGNGASDSYTVWYYCDGDDNNYYDSEISSITDISIAKVDAVCPTTGNYSGNYNGNGHSISVSGGSGGTIQYSTNNSTWSTTNPSRSAAGSQTTYVRVVGDTNHNTVSCTSRTITINKVAAVLSCSNKNYSRNNQVGCSCSGGSLGGTYQATNPGTYTASCTGDGNHTSPGNQNWSILLDLPVITVAYTTTGTTCPNKNNVFTGTVTVHLYCDPHDPGSVLSFPTNPSINSENRYKTYQTSTKGLQSWNASCTNEAGTSYNAGSFTIVSSC